MWGPNAGRGPGALPVYPWGGAQSCRPVGCQLRPRSGAGVVWGRGLLSPLSIVCVQSPKWRPGGAGGNGALPAARDLQPFPLGREDAHPEGEHRWDFAHSAVVFGEVSLFLAENKGILPPGGFAPVWAHSAPWPRSVGREMRC